MTWLTNPTHKSRRPTGCFIDNVNFNTKFLYKNWTKHVQAQVLLRIVRHFVINDILWQFCCFSLLRTEYARVTSSCSTDQYAVYERAASMGDIEIWKSEKHFEVKADFSATFWTFSKTYLSVTRRRRRLYQFVSLRIH